jgi:hypothetical protein
MFAVQIGSLSKMCSPFEKLKNWKKLKNEKIEGKIIASVLHVVALNKAF